MRWGSVVFACLRVGRVGHDGPVMLPRDGSLHGSRPSAPTHLAMQLERSKQQLPAPPQVWSIVAGGKQGSLTLTPKALSLKDVRCVRAPPLLCCMHGGLQLPAQPRTPLHAHSPALCAWRPGARILLAHNGSVCSKINWCVWQPMLLTTGVTCCACMTLRTQDHALRGCEEQRHQGRGGLRAHQLWLAAAPARHGQPHRGQERARAGGCGCGCECGVGCCVQACTLVCRMC